MFKPLEIYIHKENIYTASSYFKDITRRPYFKDQNINTVWVKSNKMRSIFMAKLLIFNFLHKLAVRFLHLPAHLKV
jgi:hypothetical protein